jgi:CBS domain-containing protein
MLSSECAACPAFGHLEVDHGEAPYLLCAAKAAQELEAPEVLDELAELPMSRPSAAAWTPAMEALSHHDLVCFRPDVGVPLASSYLQARHFGGAPVVDARGAPMGVVSCSDLLRDLDLRDGPFARVDGLMSERVYALSEHVTIARAAGEMASRRVHRVPLVNDEGVVVAMITALDIVRWLAMHDGFLGTEANPPEPLAARLPY